MSINLTEHISKTTNINTTSINNVLSLLNEGCTIPFIARYRKERTGELDEVKIQTIKTIADYFKNLNERKETILKSIVEQEKLTPEIEKQIETCTDKQILEDIYLPYKKKKLTKSIIAISKGLEPLANIILKQQPISQSKEALLDQFIAPDKGTHTTNEALQGALDIIAERISENANYRKWIRTFTHNNGIIITKVKKEFKDKETKFEMYYNFSEPLKKSVAHRLLAIRRGTAEKVLNHSIEISEDACLDFLIKNIITNKSSVFYSEIIQAITDSFKRLIYPSIENECFNEKIATAETESIQVFAKNLQNLLLAPPVGANSIMALDPGFRTGCKVAVIDNNGNYITSIAVYPNAPQNNEKEAGETLIKLINTYKVEFIAIGSGTASKETELFINKLKQSNKLTIKSVIVNESGASIYSASELAREEFPNLDITIRGAISIARRLQDPLSELIKIDPKSIGVGQYQHDVNQKELKNALDFIIEYCVNHVGVNLNTASYSLLSHVSGIGTALAKNITEYRSQITNFNSRKELKKVPKLGPKAFEQCAGFLRIDNSSEPLDNTSIHPEAYPIVKSMAVKLNTTIDNLISTPTLLESLDLSEFITSDIGLPTLRDIVKELKKPVLDPREKFTYANFLEGINEISDLSPGMILEGIVTNVTNFGAFIDIGVHQDGLIHISKLSNTFVKDPNHIVAVGQKVSVKVIEVDVRRKRISLEKI
ncbi:MAG: Tex family protein [Candidatus Riflemargulisbacteria bacterium]